MGDYNSSLLRYDYDENRVYSASVEGARTLLFLLPISCTRDLFLVGIDKTAVIVRWDGRSPKATVLRPLFEVGCGSSDVLFNDVKTDERGRFYGGTKINTEGGPCSGGEPTASFYSYESGGCLKKFFGNVSVSNGLTWVRATNKFYYIDSCTYDIKEFDYNPRNGNICGCSFFRTDEDVMLIVLVIPANKRRIFSSLMQDGTKPDYVLDGMTNDRDGNLYVGTFGGSRIIKLNPRYMFKAKLPISKPLKLI